MCFDASVFLRVKLLGKHKNCAGKDCKWRSYLDIIWPHFSFLNHIMKIWGSGKSIAMLFFLLWPFRRAEMFGIWNSDCSMGALVKFGA